MLENKFCRKLELGFDINTAPLAKIQEENAGLDRIKIFTVLDIDPNLLAFLTELNLGIIHAEVFHIPAQETLLIHSDTGRADTTWAKINFVFGLPGHKMIWWKLKDPQKAIDLQPLHNGPDYIAYQPEDCEPIFSEVITETGWLINSGDPHSVDNFTDASRWCLSYTLFDKEQDKILDWPTAVQKFAKFIKE